MTGYLAYWDELLRRHPGMFIDSCASGGRRNDLETLRRAVPLLRSDYQSFTADPGYAPGNQGHSLDDRDWMAWQFDDPEAGAGMVQAFRRKDSPFLAARFPLHGLDPAATYEVTDLDAPDAGQRFTGKALIEDGLSFTITRRPWATIFVYRRVSER